MAKVLMVQGTMSNVGKSILVTALCRIFTEDGYKVAPFKSQNMALNSFITEDGYEMGRAQVAQAEACYKKPSYLMNPILLKPTSDVGSQVIVNGKAIGNMSAKDYYKRKRDFIPYIMDAYNKLSEDNDIIVIEGAGSPAEINLKQNDIVNMGLAKMVNAPVILVGDIDRGGVFAQLFGTVELLDDDEKSLIKGLIINKFRGDKNILKPGLDIIEDLTKRKVLGVVPYLDVYVDDEDSLSERLNNSNLSKDIDIAVIRLPKISNFTDFSAFSGFDNVSLRYVNNRHELGNPNLIIIPGTKSTIADLKWLKETGLEASILKLHNSGTLVFGICGGYQMLGKKIIDDKNVEGGGSIEGLGLIDMETYFVEEKKTTQTKGTFMNVEGIFSNLNGLDYQGYEIHMGRSSGKIDNVISYHDNCYGSYIHGLFDNDGISETIIKALCVKANINFDNINKFNFLEFKESQYQKLAKMVRESLDLTEIYRILNGEK